ncbi:hypothetical protein RhiirA5_438360 [Rhizophagus irregularis]|uniref:Uncharacterized protein n=1 Tax=Rhizophagus irregularis TaxID=588596 RepID=A0A2N0NJ84_9GLOM|nr:hypothetical protein RhiirA5_438360 [Rhizophagus irregularis]
MNQSVCYDLNHIMNWQQLIETDVDNEEIYIGLQEQEQDIHQTLFKSFIKDVTQETVLEPDINQDTLLQQILAITLCFTNNSDLFGLSKKVIDSAIKADMYQELSNIFKSFLHDIQNKFDEKQQTNEDDVNNPNITKHKECPPKRL